jgi:hypothetical protein
MVVKQRSGWGYETLVMRRLKGRPQVSDLFGVRGRMWLGGLELPVEEAETLDSTLRHTPRGCSCASTRSAGQSSPSTYGRPARAPGRGGAPLAARDRWEGMLDIGLAGEVEQLLRTRPSEHQAVPRELAR